MNDHDLSAASRWYRRLWRFYPSDFRRRFEQAACEVFEARYREERDRGQPFGLARFWLRSAAIVVSSGLAERISSGLATLRAGGHRTDFVDAANSVRRGWRDHLASVLCISLGIAATGAVLTLVSSTLLKPLPFPDADRLMRVWSVEESVELAGRGHLAYPDIADLRGSMRAFDALALTGRARRMFLGEDGARRVEGEAVSPEYFDLLGVEPFIGRGFTAEDHEAGSPPTMLLSFATWTREYGADPELLGETIQTAERTFTIIGVMPQGFLGTIEADIPDIEFWVPLEHHVREAWRTDRDVEFLWAIGRLARGGTLSQARSEAETLGARLQDQGVLGPADGFWVEPFGENWRVELRLRNLLLLGASLLLLLVAATNVAGLQLARALERQRDVAVRAAMGASRARIFRLSALETLMVSVMGGVIGIAVAPRVLDTFLRLAPEAVPGYLTLEPDHRSLGIALFVICGAALVSALAPAALSARVAPASVLGSGGRTSTRSRRDRRASRALVIGEVALSTILVSSAVLLVQSYRAMGTADVGFRTNGILKLAVFVDDRDVPDDSALPAFYDELRARVSAVPGVEGIGFASPTVPPGFSGEGRVRFDGMSDAMRERGILAYTHLVDPTLMTVLEIPILLGRGIAATDNGDSAPVVVISESLAELIGGAEAAVGRSLELFGIDFGVVGVAGDVMYLGAATPRPRDVDVYLPIAQDPSRVVSMALRTPLDPATLVEPVRQVIAQLTPRSPLDWIATMSDDLQRGFEGPRFYTLLLAVFAGSALLLTGAGVFAVLARMVVSQRSELGIRRAFGAHRRHLIGSVIRSGATLCLVGVGIGAAGALAVAGLLGRTMYGVQSFDVRGLAVAAAVLLVTGLAASAIPAYRATATDPTEAMRAS